MMYPVMYNKLFKEVFIEYSGVKDLVETCLRRIEQDRTTTESIDYFTDEIYVLNGSTVKEVIQELKTYTTELGLEEITRQELEEFRECEIHETASYMESSETMRLQLIGVGDIKTLTQERKLENRMLAIYVDLLAYQ
jgi:uncharacterized membrane protein YgaE (UPF0421/DUF939 family)